MAKENEPKKLKLEEMKQDLNLEMVGGVPDVPLLKWLGTRLGPNEYPSVLNPSVINAILLARHYGPDKETPLFHHAVCAVKTDHYLLGSSPADVAADIAATIPFLFNALIECVDANLPTEEAERLVPAIEKIANQWDSSLSPALGKLFPKKEGTPPRNERTGLYGWD